MHLLVLRFSAMGDVALVAPVLNTLLRNHPHLRITLVSRPQFEPFFYGIPNLRFFGADLSGRHKGQVGVLRLYQDLRKAGAYEAVVDLHSVLRTWLLSSLFRLTGTKTFSVDKGRKEKKQLVRQKDKVLKKLAHSTDRYFQAFRPLGLTGNLREPAYIQNSPEAEEALALFLRKRGLTKGSDPWIGVAPFARHAPKIWPYPYLKELLSLLQTGLRAKVYLFGGGKEEEKKLTELEQAYPSAVNVSTELSLAEGLALQNKLDLMVSMDSANMHMGALSGTRVVSIWGPTHPYAGFGALYQPDDYAIQVPTEELTCRPCSVFGDKHCLHCQHACMERIRPDQVFAKIQEILKGELPSQLL